MAEVALLLGMPISLPEFVSRTGQSDWLAKFDRAEGTPTERHQHLVSVWERQYYPLVAEPLLELIDAASRLDVDVRSQATLRTIADTTTTRRVVILFGHWKGAEIANDDILPPKNLQSFVERTGFDTPLTRWLRERFRQLDSESRTAPRAFLHKLRWKTRPAATLVSILRDALTTPLAEGAAEADGIDRIIQHELFVAANRRDELDSLFDGLLKPGNRLELFDALHAKEAVESAVAPDFDGVLDLTTCNSTVLANHLATRRDFRFRTVQFPTVLEPLLATQYLKATLELMRTAALPYLQARVLARQGIEQAVADIKNLDSVK